MDVVDYRITRAVVRYRNQQPVIDVEQGLPDEHAAANSDAQERFNLVLAHYQAGAISLARAAGLLDPPGLDLRTRFQRLDVPLGAAPVNVDEAKRDVEEAEKWARPPSK